MSGTERRSTVRSSLDRIKRITLGPDPASWKDLLRDRRRPWRTALGTGLGALVGGMPLLGVHTWIAAGLGAILPVPPLTVLVGSNVSNPLTFLPLTWLEIRVGQLLLDRRSGFTWDGFSAGTIGTYWFEAWVGFVVVGPALALLTAAAVRVVLARRASK